MTDLEEIAVSAADRAPPADLAFLFVRHGETDWNREGRLQGRRDIPMNALGREQATRNGRTLAVFLKERGIDVNAYRFVSSPLARTRETMERLREAMGLAPMDYETDDRLKEITFGQWEGMTLAELKAQNPEGHAARRADKWGFIPPDGESYAMLSERLAGWLASLDGPMIAVSHGGVNRVLRGLLEGIPAADIPILDVPQDKVYVMRATGVALI